MRNKHLTESFLLGILTTLLGFMLLSPVQVGLAQESGPSDDEVNQIASQLYCPVCENIPLDVCPTEACEQWRALIRQKLIEGWTEEEIKAYFVAQYGDRVLSEPPRRGLNWLIYILPVLVIFMGVLLLLRVFRRRHLQQEPTNQMEDRDDPYLEQVEHDLNEMM